MHPPFFLSRDNNFESSFQFLAHSTFGNLLKFSKAEALGTKVSKRELPPRPVAVRKIENVRKEKAEKEEIIEGDTISSGEPKERAPRAKPTIEGHVEKYNKILELLDAEIDRKSREKEK